MILTDAVSQNKKKIEKKKKIPTLDGHFMCLHTKCYLSVFDCPTLGYEHSKIEFIYTNKFQKLMYKVHSLPYIYANNTIQQHSERIMSVKGQHNSILWKL